MSNPRHAAPDIGGDINNGTGPFLFNPFAGRRLHHPPGAIQIGVNHSVPAFGGIIKGGLRELATSVVDQNIQLSEPGMNIVNEAVNLLRITDIELSNHNLAAETFEKRRRSLQFFRVAAADGEIGAQAREQGRNCTAKTTARPRHDNYLPGKQIRLEYSRVFPKLSFGKSETTNRHLSHFPPFQTMFSRLL